MSADFTPEKEDYGVLSPFKMQVLTNFPYIEADFDALTNYQLLCKVVEYLNNVIHNENEVTEQITSLYNAYVSLQNYVNNYFDNLDLQEEVNKKIDELVEDGTITNLIKGYVDPIYQEYEASINDIIDDQNSTIGNAINAQNSEISTFKDTVNASLDVINNKVNSITSGTPKGVYATASDLSTADPDHDYIYLVTEDGKWYYYDSGTSLWTAGGTYQQASNQDQVNDIQNQVTNLGANLIVNSYSVPQGVTTNFYLKVGKTYKLKYIGNDGGFACSFYIDGYTGNSVAVGTFTGVVEFTPTASGFVRLYITNGNNANPIVIHIIGEVDIVKEDIINIETAIGTDINIPTYSINTGITTDYYLEAGKSYRVNYAGNDSSFLCSFYINGYTSNQVPVGHNVPALFTPTNNGYVRIYPTNGDTSKPIKIHIAGMYDNFGGYIYGYNVNTVGPTNIYVEENDLIKVIVSSNTIQTNLFVREFVEGDRYLTIPQGSGTYYYHASKNGFLQLQSTATSISAKIYVLNNVVNQNNVEEYYVVDKDGNGDFTSFSDMEDSLANNTNKKLIIVNNGLYDIFEEYGGAEYISSLDPSTITGWREVSKIVPDNSHIIGVGNVVLSWEPTLEQAIDFAHCQYFSPLNVSGTCTIENITVKAKNCRYAIHDEASGLSKYDNAIHKYINVTAHKTFGNIGYTQCFGAGLGKNAYWSFEKCQFYSDRENIFTIHTPLTTTTNKDTCNIYIDSCIFDNYNHSLITNTTSSVKFIVLGLSNHGAILDNVYINNSYLYGNLTLEGQEGTNITNCYSVTALKNTYHDITLNNIGTNPYNPKVYN